MGLKVQEGSRQVRHQWLPNPLPPPPYNENSHRIFTFCMDPTGQLSGGSGSLDPPPGQLRRWLQPSLAFCFSLQLANDVISCKLKLLMRAATVVQVLQDLFYVLLHVLFYL